MCDKKKLDLEKNSLEFKSMYIELYKKYNRIRITAVELSRELNISYEQLLKHIKNNQAPKYHLINENKRKPKYYFLISDVCWWLLEDR